MAMIIYQPQIANETEFVEFWSLRYQYAEEHLYDDNIGQDLTENRILDLFRWKNGRLLSSKKLTSVQNNFVARREELAQLPNDTPANVFLEQFPNGGAIWRIFWLHCWQPERFPIYDQHVHRAMTFIENGATEEIPRHGPRKIDSYLQSYLPFHGEFEYVDSRTIDRALWAFGKFLNENNFPLR